MGEGMWDVGAPHSNSVRGCASHGNRDLCECASHGNREVRLRYLLHGEMHPRRGVFHNTSRRRDPVGASGREVLWLRCHDVVVVVDCSSN